MSGHEIQLGPGTGASMTDTLRRNTLTTVIVAFVLASLSLAVTSRAQERSDTEGIKETERFVKSGDQMSQAVADAKLQVQNTLSNYNMLVAQPAKDMKGAYKKLLKNVKDMNDKVTDARVQVDEMQATGDTYFAGRAASIKKIQNEALRNQAQQRLEASQKEYASVLAALREAGTSLEPVRKELVDQINYLGSDLSPSGTASLKAQATKVQADSAVTFAKSDTAMKKAGDYFNGLRAR
jgi:hypothetical protein